MPDYNELIDRYYAPGTRRREILVKHSRRVADKALEISRSLGLDLDETTVEAAAMLHDIGIVATDAPGIDCHGTEPYLRHGIIGARMIREAGFPEEIARVAERHTGAGISPEDIVAMNLPLPPGDYMPHTLLERLVCYADKFFSKSGDMKEKPLERVRLSMAKHSPETVTRFEALHKEFGAGHKAL